MLPLDNSGKQPSKQLLYPENYRKTNSQSSAKTAVSTKWIKWPVFGFYLTSAFQGISRISANAYAMAFNWLLLENAQLFLEQQ